MTNRQSMKRACPALPIVATNWSMMPHGILANVCSARWQHWALISESTDGTLVELLLMLRSKDSRNVNVATSRDAELDRPPPSGTDETTTASKEGSWPANERYRFVCLNWFNVHMHVSLCITWWLIGVNQCLQWTTFWNSLAVLRQSCGHHFFSGPSKARNRPVKCTNSSSLGVLRFSGCPFDI